MLRVAVPNKGALSTPAREMLAEAGYLGSTSPRELMIHDPVNEVEFFFLRPKDIATYVGGGTLDLGITGQDMLIEAGRPAEPLLELGFGGSTFRLAVPADAGATPADLAGRRIATSYPALLAEWLDTQAIGATIVRLDGAVENAVRLGVADAVADVVDTGTTIRLAGLHIIGEPLLTSQAVLVAPPGKPGGEDVERFVRRLQGVIVARTYVLVDYDIPAHLVDRACAITPGLESPTVSPLRDREWVAIRAMVRRSEIHTVMDELFTLGGRGILVTDIHACRL
ncbi:MAG: ATP phosphoribosyltransferase [Actinobacteria bacterium]|nr:ATP phosphoribosyltransferase [Actinomycetota bacterium]